MKVFMDVLLYELGTHGQQHRQPKLNEPSLGPAVLVQGEIFSRNAINISQPHAVLGTANVCQTLQRLRSFASSQPLEL